MVNVANIQEGGLGTLGQEQLDWLEKDVKSLSTSTPIVLFAHIPLWAVYPQWGWGTDDAERALSFVKRFGSVTVLNGHIHQVMQKVEGNVTFHTARGTAFPLPTPGSVPKPIPTVVEATSLLKLQISGAHMTLVIQSGIKGEMPSFSKKYNAQDTAAIVAYLKTLH